MQITRAGEYAVLGMLNLARRGSGRVVMIDQVSRDEAIPRSFLAKLFQQLAKADLLRSVRGSGGGFVLEREPARITVLEIIEAIEGRIALQRCLEEIPGCVRAGACPLCGLLGEAQSRVREVFRSASLADLLRQRPVTTGRALRDPVDEPMQAVAAP